MKTKLLLSALILLYPFSFFLSPCSAQVPQGFNYQAIARDGSGNILANLALPVRISIQADSAGSTVYWTELHSSVTSNNFGLITLVVGRGTRVAGTALTFDAIDWSVTPIFIKTEVNHGAWITMGISRLWSVPYALTSITNNPWLLNGSSLYYSGGYVGVETNTPVTPLTVTQNDNTGITYPLYIQNASGDWTDAEKGVGLKFGRINPTSGHDYGTIRGTIASANGGAGRLQFTGGGGIDPHMTIDHIGNVGIGTTSPVNKLQIGDLTNGNPTSTPSSLSLSSDFGNKAIGTNLKLILYQDLASNNYGLGISSGLMELTAGPSGSMAFFTNGANERMRILSDGTVGIGTASPDKLLTVKSSVTNTQIAKFADDARYIGIGRDQISAYDLSGNLANFYIGGYNMTIASSGNVGIGTMNPNDRLDVNGNILVEGTIGGQHATGYGTVLLVGNDSKLVDMNIANTMGVYGLEDETQGHIKLGSAGPVISGVNGNVGIGTTTPSSKMTIQPDATWSDNVPLFEVKNKYGVDVLAVYNTGVRIQVEHDDAKGVKGGFSVGGYDMTKAGATSDFMIISPDSIKFNISNTNAKSVKGGFSVGGYDASKGYINQDFMSLTPTFSKRGEYNTFLGYDAGKNSTGPHNTFFGVNAGTSLSGNNSASNIFIGEGAGLKNYGGYTSATFNLPGGGSTTVYNSGGGENVAIGNYTGVRLTGVYSLGSWSGGQHNVLLGHYAGSFITTGSNNVIIGHYAGSNLVTGSGNVFVGYYAGFNETLSNKLYIANSSTTSPLIYGDFNLGYIGINGSMGVGISSPSAQLDVNGISYFRGNVGIGTSTPQSALHVKISNGSGHAVNINNTNTGTSAKGIAIALGNENIGAEFISFYKADYSATVGSITRFGSSVSYNTTSDARLKENIALSSFTINDLMKIKVRDFNFINDNTKTKVTGFIAQELYDIFPYAVYKPIDDKDYWAIDYGKVTPVIVKAVQDQEKLIEKISDENQQLKLQNQSLRDQVISLQSRVDKIEAKLAK